MEGYSGRDCGLTEAEAQDRRALQELVVDCIRNITVDAISPNEDGDAGSSAVGEGQSTAYDAQGVVGSLAGC